MPTRLAAQFCLLLTAGISLWGCASTSSTVVQASESPEFNLEATPTASQAFRIAVEPRGQTGWTGDLPVVSPGGDRMAMADPERPGDILIRSIPNNRLDEPMVLGRVPGPIRFGRSVDNVGFAVMDGERVGRASWVGGTVEWFADQSATDLDLGPNDSIAFIQKGELIVRTPTTTLRLEDDTATWHGPRWQGDNGTLFCWRVRDGALDLVRFRTNVEDSAAQPLPEV